MSELEKNSIVKQCYLNIHNTIRSHKIYLKQLNDKKTAYKQCKQIIPNANYFTEYMGFGWGVTRHQYQCFLHGNNTNAFYLRIIFKIPQ